MARSQEFRRGQVPAGPPTSWDPVQARPFCKTCNRREDEHAGGSRENWDRHSQAAQGHTFERRTDIDWAGNKVKPIPEDLKGLRQHFKKEHFTPYAGYNYLHDEAGPNKDRPRITSGEHRLPEPSMDIDELRRQHEVEHHLWGGDHGH